MTTLPIHMSGLRYAEPVGKSIERGPSGSLVKEPLLAARGTAGEIWSHRFATPREAFEFRLGGDAKMMGFAGTWGSSVSSESVAVSKAALDRAPLYFDPWSMPSLVAATRAYLTFASDPGLIIVDIDVKRAGDVAALAPIVGAPESIDEVRSLIVSVLPEASQCPMLIMASTSSMIEDEATGELLAGPGGYRVYIVTLDATHTPRILDTIHQRCWARGIFAYAFVSRGGVILPRSLADLAMGRATQPDYFAARLGSGLRKTTNFFEIYNVDGPYLDPSGVQLSSEDRDAAATRMADVRKELEPFAREVREQRLKELTAERTTEGRAAADVRRVLRSRLEGMLVASDAIELVTGEVVSVATLLSPDGKDYDGAICRDPMEPDYDGGRAVAKFYWNEGGIPRLHSFAHGSQSYRLAYDLETGAALIPTAERETVLDILAKAAVDELSYVELETLAAQRLALGNRRLPLRTAVTKRRTELRHHEPASEVQEPDLPSDDQPLRAVFPAVSLKGNPFDHVANVRFLLDGYRISYRYNEITKEFEYDQPASARSGDHDGETFMSRMISLASLNGVPTRSLHSHLTALAGSSACNPVVDYLEGLGWDGTPRFEQVAGSFTSADPAIASIAFRVFLIQACAAADHAHAVRSSNVRPSFEIVLVLVGMQGAGKTKGIRRLLPGALRPYYKEGVILDLQNKDSIKQGTSAWVVELGELDSTFKRSDITNLKAFLSREFDEMRLPYARVASRYERRTVFVGTVNELEFLADMTGARRFIPLYVDRWQLDLSDDEIDQLWAEAWHRYQQGEEWWPTAEEEKLLSENAERYRLRSAVEEKIEGLFDWEAGVDLSSRQRWTATEICERVFSGSQGRVDAGTLRAVGNTVRRLLARQPGVVMRAEGPTMLGSDGSWVRLYEAGGKNRGWLLPPPHQTAISELAASVPLAMASLPLGRRPPPFGDHVNGEGVKG